MRRGAAKYRVVFRGEILDGLRAGTVKKKLATALKTNEENIEKLFPGKAVILKKSVDIKTAALCRKVFRKAGAVCRIVPESPAK